MSEHPAVEGRLRRLQSIARSEGIEAVLVADPANIRYLTGFTGSESYLLVTVDGTDSLLVVDGRYTEQASREVRGVRIAEHADKMEGVLACLAAMGPGSVGFEAAALTYDRFLKLRDSLPETTGLAPLTGPIALLRSRKDAGEIARLKQAAAIAARSLKLSLASLTPGMPEREFALLLNNTMLREGSEGPAFETIVASGENAALPHARPGERPVAEGDLVVIDYGAVFEGYHCDESCTVSLGKQEVGVRRIYDTVLAAHDRALEAVRPGVLCRDIDAAARGHIEQAGYGSSFVHGTGHGVGLRVHEAPTLSRKSEDRLEEGMVVTIEPGIYLPGVCGVRIEDMVLVTGDGCEIVTEMPKSFMEL